MSATFEIRQCEVCGSKQLLPVLNLGAHPMCDDLIPIGHSATSQIFPIEILYCQLCRTAHQRYQIQKAKLFPQTYHYRSRLTADVLSGMEDLVESTEKNVGPLKDRTVLDIGCNDGSLLDIFAAKGARTIGVEPTGASVDATGRSHQIYEDYFSPSLARRIRDLNPRIDVITFTNVFAHIEDLPALVEALLVLVNDDTSIVIENHYLASVLQSNQFDTFYHEHPRTYSLHSFMYIARSLGLSVSAVEFPRRYGGNIRVTIGPRRDCRIPASNNIKSTLEKEQSLQAKFADMNQFMEEWRLKKSSEIKCLAEEFGKLTCKAFPGRAAILVRLLGLTDEQIECVYEKPTSLKIGHYVPGTRIPIISEQELFKKNSHPPVMINLAWHISEEINTYLRSHGYRGTIIDIM